MRIRVLEEKLSQIRKFLHTNFYLYKKISIFYYLHIYPLPFKILYLNKADGKTVLFYPQKPHPMEVLYKVFHLKGYRITNDPNVKSDIVVNYEDTTVRTRNDITKYIDKNQYVLNQYCADISKKRVEMIFKKVFGYGLEINPQKYKGSYVRKSNLNAKHDGVILTKAQKPRKGFVYQKIINNQEKSMVVDFRAPFIIGVIPFVYLKYRPLKIRFSNTNMHIKIYKFCKLMGADYGELDILRNKDDGNIYIIDVNNTPSGPPNHLDDTDSWKALNIIADTFMERVAKIKK